MGFAHRGLHGPGVPENSLAAFRAALAAGAGIECDVRLSGDGVPVLFHDHDLRRLCASGLAVESASAAQLAAQTLFDSEEHIPRLKELLALVGGEVPLLLEIKCQGRNIDALAASVVEELISYSGPVGVMSFEPAVGRWLLRNAPDIRRGLVISRRATRFATWRGIRAAAPHFLAVDRAVIDSPWVRTERQRRPVYSWTIASAAERGTAQVHADALIWEGDGRPGS